MAVNITFLLQGNVPDVPKMLCLQSRTLISHPLLFLAWKSAHTAHLWMWHDTYCRNVVSRRMYIWFCRTVQCETCHSVSWAEHTDGERNKETDWRELTELEFVEGSECSERLSWGEASGTFPHTWSVHPLLAGIQSGRIHANDQICMNETSLAFCLDTGISHVKHLWLPISSFFQPPIPNSKKSK